MRLPRSLASLALLACLLSESASAQLGLELRRTWVNIPGLGELLEIPNSEVDDKGRVLWKGIAPGITPTPWDTLSFIGLDSEILIRERDALPQLEGASLEEISRVLFLGDSYVYSGMIRTSSGIHSALVGEQRVILMAGEPTLAPGWPLGTIWEHVQVVDANHSNQLLVRGLFSTYGVLPKTVLAIVNLDAAGRRRSERVIAVKGAPAPGGGTLDGFPKGVDRYRLSDSGDVLWTGIVEAPHTWRVFMNSTPVLESGDPAGAGTWGYLVGVDMNDQGQWTALGATGAIQTFHPDTILKDGQILFQAGMPFPGNPGEVLLQMGSTRPFLDSQGGVSWVGDSDAMSTFQAVLFHDDSILAQRLDPLGGVPFYEVDDQNYRVSPNGRFQLVDLIEGTGAIQVLVDRDLDFDLCAGSPNSTGVPAGLSAGGLASLQENSFKLSAHDLPPGQPSFFLMSKGADSVPVGQGTLCLGPPLWRFNASLQTTLASGHAGAVIDLASLPALFRPQPGQTAYFQLWYRDLNPGPTSNLSGAIGVGFYN